MSKKILLNIISSALLSIVFGVLVYKLFLGVSTYCALYIFHSQWYMNMWCYLANIGFFVIIPYQIYLCTKRTWILGIASFFLTWIVSLIYFQYIKYDDATTIGVDCFVVQKNNKVGIIDKWGHAITQTEFDGYCSCSGHESWNDSVHEDKPTKAIGILLKDRTFYAVYRNANILQANQIREIKSPFLFKDIQANAYRIEDYCISNNDNDKVFGYIVYSSDNSWYSFFNQEGQIIGGGEEFVLNNEGTLSLKRENTWFEYTGNIIKEMNERKTYEFDLGEEHGGKQICRADDFSDEVIDLSSFLPINGGEHTYMLVGEISNNNKVKMVSNDSNKKQIVEKQKYIDNSQGGVIRTPTPIQRPQTCGICGGTGRCSECGGSGISHFAHDHICGACNGNGKCTTCAGKGISGYITEYVY